MASPSYFIFAVEPKFQSWRTRAVGRGPEFIFSNDLSMSEPIKRWKLTRTLQITPSRYFQHLGLFCAVLLTGCLAFVIFDRTGAAVLCMAQGLIAVIGATWFAVHAGDGDEIVLYSDQVVATTYAGLQSYRRVFPLRQTAIQAGIGTNAGRYWISFQSEKIELGARLSLADRCLIASEIAWAIRMVRNSPDLSSAAAIRHRPVDSAAMKPENS